MANKRHGRPYSPGMALKEHAGVTLSYLLHLDLILSMLNQILRDCCCCLRHSVVSDCVSKQFYLMFMNIPCACARACYVVTYWVVQVLNEHKYLFAT